MQHAFNIKHILQFSHSRLPFTTLTYPGDLVGNVLDNPGDLVGRKVYWTMR